MRPTYLDRPAELAFLKQSGDSTDGTFSKEGGAPAVVCAHNAMQRNPFLGRPGVRAPRGCVQNAQAQCNPLRHLPLRVYSKRHRCGRAGSTIGNRDEAAAIGAAPPVAT